MRTPGAAISSRSIASEGSRTGFRPKCAQARRSAHAAVAARRQETGSRDDTSSLLKPFGHHRRDRRTSRHHQRHRRACGAAARDRIPPDIVRAIAVVSRSAGLVGHILEEQQTNSARHLVKLARDTIPYRNRRGSSLSTMIDYRGGKPIEDARYEAIIYRIEENRRPGSAVITLLLTYTFARSSLAWRRTCRGAASPKSSSRSPR